MAATCRAFRRLSEPIRWRAIRFSTPTKIRSLMAMGPPPHVLQHVRTVSCYMQYLGDSKDRRRRNGSAKLFEGLDALELLAYKLRNPVEWRFLPSYFCLSLPDSEALRSLSLVPRFPLMVIGRPTLSSWLTFTQRDQGSTFSRHIKITYSHITHIQLSDWNWFTSRIMTEALRGLPQLVKINVSFSTNELAKFLSLQFPSLRHLQMDIRACNDTWDTLNQYAGCLSSLRSLRVTTEGSSPEFGIAIRARLWAESLLSLLSQGLEELSINLFSYMDQDIMDMIHSLLPNLRACELHGLDSEHPTTISNSISFPFPKIVYLSLHLTATFLQQYLSTDQMVSASTVWEGIRWMRIRLDSLPLDPMHLAPLLKRLCNLETLEIHILSVSSTDFIPTLNVIRAFTTRSLHNLILNVPVRTLHCLDPYLLGILSFPLEDKRDESMRSTGCFKGRLMYPNLDLIDVAVDADVAMSSLWKRIVVDASQQGLMLKKPQGRLLYGTFDRNSWVNEGW
ncbi:hypothetical protein HDU67_003546 [Dinochytrium kinnereticum]|nr:hypothetical protein HDU67_003546 [Dinochytrium kinnereticum]